MTRENVTEERLRWAEDARFTATADNPAGAAMADVIVDVVDELRKTRNVVTKLVHFIEAARRIAIDDGREDDRVEGSKMNVALSPWEVVKLLGDLAPSVEAPSEGWAYARNALRTK